MNTCQLAKNKELDIKKGLVVPDNKGNYWIHNQTGKVWYVDKDIKEVKSFQLMPDELVSYIDGERYHVVHDSRDIIRISTYGNGLFAYDK